jgi:hypothetical protein
MSGVLRRSYHVCKSGLQLFLTLRRVEKKVQMSENLCGMGLNRGGGIYRVMRMKFEFC